MNILITGGASGLGEAITRELARDPANKIYFTYCHSQTKASDLENEFSNAKAIHYNVEDENSVNALVSQLEVLNIEVLVNNALTGLQTNHFHKLAPEYFLENFKLNVMPVIKLTQKAITHFRKQKSGRIITVLSSYVTGKPPIGLSEYVASKNYLGSLSNSWAAENSKFNIVSNCLSPSFMQTGLTADTDERIIEEMANSRPDKKLLTTSEAAQGIVYFLNAPLEVNGTNLVINSISDIPKQ